MKTPTSLLLPQLTATTVEAHRRAIRALESDIAQAPLARRARLQGELNALCAELGAAGLD